MKLITLLISTVALVSAQSAATVPACVQTCFTSSLASGGSCASTDLACLCASSAFQEAIATCLKSSCSAADLATGLTFAQSTCAAVGVTVNPSSIAGEPTGTSASSAIASASSAASSVSSATSRASASASSVASSGSSVLASVASSVKSAIYSATQAAGTAAATSSKSAASTTVIAQGGLIGALAAVLLAL